MTKSIHDPRRSGVVRLARAEPTVPQIATFTGHTLWALARLAAICFAVAMEALLLGGFVGIVTLAPGIMLGLLAKHATAVFPGRHHAIEHLEASAFELRGLGVKLVQRAAHR
jgi:hypothetical protein